MPFSFNAVKLCVVTIIEKPWTFAKEVCKALRYEKAARRVVRHHCTRENYAHKWILAGLVSETKPVNWPTDLQKLDLYINEEGMTELLVRIQQPLAKELAEYMGIKIIRHKYVRKEAGTI